MKVVFPNLGNLTTILCAFMRDMNGSFVGPIPTSSHTVELGSKYAPNDACMPMKIVLGNFIEGYENGADTALFFGGCGPCCFGYFAETFQLIFRQNDINMKVITLENDISGVKNAMMFLAEACEKPLINAAPLIAKGLQCAGILDEYEQAVYHKQAEITDKKERNRLKKFDTELQRKMNSAPSLRALSRLAKDGKNEILKFKSDSDAKIKIGVVGDIYSVIDPFMNKKIQYLLADMGVYTRRSMTLGNWIDEKVFKKHREWENFADKFLPRKVGGFARETVGNAALWASRDFDGIIEIYPLNCMPESVAKTILPKVSEEYATPVMSLIVDEMSGEAGYITRLEAFTQMILRKKDAEFEKNVSGH